MTEHSTPLAGPEKDCLEVLLKKPRMRRDQASKYLEQAHGITMAPATLATLATRGGGPPFQKINRTPLYPRISLDTWAAEKLGPLRDSTSTE